jgi:hypothetical protein
VCSSDLLKNINLINKKESVRKLAKAKEKTLNQNALFVNNLAI